MAKTLDDIRIESRNRADMTGSEFVSDDELNRYINDSLGELYDMLVQEYGVDNFLDGYEFNTVVGQSRYDLPTDFYKFAGLDLQNSGTYYSLTRFAHSDRLLYRNASDFVVDGLPKHRYRLRKMHLDVLPAPEAIHSCVLHYIPQITELVNSSDVIDSAIVESWLEFVHVDAAIKMLIKEESDVQEMLMTKQALTQRIRASAQGRDIDVPEVAPDAGETLFNLRIQARYKANMLGKGTTLNSDLVSDRELTHYINNSLGELHDYLIKAYEGQYFVDSYQFATVSGQKDYNLPDDFYKLGGVDVLVGGQIFPLTNYNFQERNLYENDSITTYLGAPYFRYHIQSNSIRLLPLPDSVHTITLWYSKSHTSLTSDTDVISNVLVKEWMEFVIIDAARKMLQKVSIGAPQQQLQSIQGAIQALSVQKSEFLARFEQMISFRDWGKPETITDTALSESIYMWR